MASQFWSIALIAILSQSVHSQNGTWFTDNSPAIEYEGPLVRSNANEKTVVPHNAMWIDGDGVNSGQHYWTINFPTLPISASVGLSNRNRFGQGYKMRGLFYNGNLWAGRGALVQNFGPGIVAGDTLGILVSISEGRLQLYFYHNSTPLGLAFDLPASILPDLYPAVTFSGRGVASIRKEVQIPVQRAAVLKKYEGIEGAWKVVPNSVQINGTIMQNEARFNPHDVTMKISSQGDQRSSQYVVVAKVVNTFSCRVEMGEISWRTLNGVYSTRIGVYGKSNLLEGEMDNLMKGPDSVHVDENQVITIKKGTTTISFERFDDTPRGFVGTPSF